MITEREGKREGRERMREREREREGGRGRGREISCIKSLIRVQPTINFALCQTTIIVV